VIATEGAVADARPPKVVLSVINPMLRVLLRTPVSRAIKPLALLQFDGRRTGRRRSVVVAWHANGGRALVVTPAKWRVNFTDGHGAEVRWRGQRIDAIGTLITDPEAVAEALNTLLNNGVRPSALALRVPDGHVLSSSDVVGTGRAIINFQRQ